MKTPYTRYDYDNDLKVRLFVQKRDRLRKLDIILFFGGLFAIAIAHRLFPFQLEFEYRRLYTVFVVVWFAIQIILSNYIAHQMSVCPVCHIHIPTATPRRGNRDRKVTGNGPLPDECPYCGTTFYDKH